MILNTFYFIKEQYFIDFQDQKLMRNKELVNGKPHNRPCFYAFKDTKYDIYWCIPFSSKVDKYKMEYDKKIKKYGKCDTIVFGYVLGDEKAFLIQNMCPITSEYINNQYINCTTNEPVSISTNLSNEIIKKAKRILNLEKRGKRLVFTDITNMKKILIGKITTYQEVAADIEQNENSNNPSTPD